MYCYDRPDFVDECPDPCICATTGEAERLGLELCPGERVELIDPVTGEGTGIYVLKPLRCGSQNNQDMYCYLPPEEEEEEDCPAGCVCLSDLEAKRGSYSLCGGKRISCQYEPGSAQKWCFEQAVPTRITLEPTQDANPIGTTHTVTVMVYDAYGDPLANATVSISVSGANSYASGTVTTNSSGKAEFEYSGKNIGSDIIQATIDGISATAFKEWYRK
jgi:hypothetical protein